jgi:hypothetical protein
MPLCSRPLTQSSDRQIRDDEKKGEMKLGKTREAVEMTRKPVFQQHSDDETVSIRKKTAL